MDIDIAPYLKELLYKHNNLVIPGFGNFVLSYAASTIDHVQGILQPPSKKIEFDENLITNDGKLLAYIQEKHQLNTEDATAIINTFVSKIKAQLGQREMVVIPEVGRLYKDFENNIQFIADPTNFRKESFGLPSITFYPILREKTVTTTATTPKTATTVSSKTNSATKSIPKQEKSFFDTLLSSSWLPYALVLLVAALATFLIYPRLATNNTVESKEARVNQKPIKTEEASEDPREDLIDREMEEAAREEVDPIDTESITVAPDQKECIVSIGVFSVKENATKLIKNIYELGYEPYSDNYTRNGTNYTKVGIQFGYETETELNYRLEKIKKSFPSAVVIEK